MVKISAVRPGSIAAQLGWSSGDDLESINGHPVTDFLDYHFQQAEEELAVVVKHGMRRLTFQISKTYDEDLGLELQPPRMRACGNNCIFCFVKQNPPGMRESLYFPDEDYRYSFLHGAYITLTNLRESDLERIAQLRLSPLYISVHATAEAVRRQIFQLKKPDHFWEKLNFLREQRIDLHTQIVLLPGINDGAVLEQSLKDLYQFRDVILSVAIVPVGLTKHRAHLPAIQPVGRQEAEKVWQQAQNWSHLYRNRDGEGWVYLADEFYLLAQKRLPGRHFYGSFYQIENGVGLTRHFLDDFRCQARRFPTHISRSKRILFVTGTLAAPILAARVLPRMNRITNFRVDIKPVVNNFYGPSVTVAGLLTGQDILAQCESLRDYDQVVLPPRCVNNTGRLLDDLTPEELAVEWRKPVRVFNGDFLALIRDNHG